MKRALVWLFAIVAVVTDRSWWSGGATRDLPARGSTASALAAAIVRHPWMALGAAGSALAVLVMLGVASGVAPITASSGHWAVTEWFLHFALERSVATHAAGIEPPPLDDPRLVLTGAGHYETGCRPCHGDVAGTLPVVPQAMTPHPPALPGRVNNWTDGQLFYIVKHGVKFTGMPAWPAQERDDEVWAVVAFLRVLPTLGRDEYHELVRGREASSIADLEPAAGTQAASPPQAVAETCARCHGADGTGRGAGAFPKLAGQRVAYLDAAMRAYAAGERHSGIMQPIAAALTEDGRREVSEFYARLSPAGAGSREPASGPEAGSRGAADPVAAAGAAIANRGVPDQKIPSCLDCHGPAGADVNPAYPRLDGQYPEYLAQQLELMRERKRGGSPYVHLMHAFVERLTDEQIDQVTRFFAAQPQ